MTSPRDVASALRPWFAARLGVDDAAISDLKRHAEGWSWQTYTMTVEWADPPSGESRRRGFAVRREPEDGLLAPYDTDQQFRLHKGVIDNSSVPMAPLHWLEPDPATLGMPFYVMDRVDGIVPVQWRANDLEVFPDDSARRSIGLDFVDVLASIHAIDVEALAGVFDTPVSAEAAAISQIDQWESFYADARLLEVPLLRACIGWLRRNVATSGKLALVHGDYRIGNFMLGPDRRINAVFDWELAHIGDPVFDIAWAGMPLFRGKSPLFSQLLAPDEFIGRYEETTGLTVDADVLRFWTVFGHLRASAPHIKAARAFADGKTGDLRLAAMGHQNLYILKQLAAQLGWEVPQRGQAAAMTATEGSPLQVPLTRIFEGVVETLADDVAPHVADPYAKSQVMAAIELMANLATRVEWSPRDQMETITKVREVLRDVPAGAPESVARMLAGPPPDASDAAAVGTARREHLEALTVMSDWLDAVPGEETLRSAVLDFLLDDLAAELGRLRSGMYRTRKPSSE